MNIQRSTQEFQLLCFGFGQAIMLLNACTGILSKYLSNAGTSVPTLQSTFVYVLLAGIYIPLRLWRRQRPTGVKWWFYALLGFVDVEANYCAVKAFNYANFATLGLLLNLTIPFVTLFTYVFLKTRYRMLHYVGALVAITGSVVIFVSDYSSSADTGMSRAFKGDLMAVAAAAMYATSNVMFQSVVMVRDMNSNIEALGMMGFFAMLFSGIQVAVTERGTINESNWTGPVYGYIAGYVLVMVTFYTITSVFLRWAESLMFNLNLLTAPIFTVFASYYFFNESVKSLYWLALVLFYVGLFIYCVVPPPEQQMARPQNEDVEYEFAKFPVAESVDKEESAV
ncbi:TPA: hypothetical protein N0F65_008812 [Lagenidium giganteum]|uniref:Drug/Metabolite Transporter (DMT) Superfamily n=1 Tax=Lagenidium giganteum TaxID=4803 RepID=A0AAV2YWJ4_9STRA|nr:TPA: hypothetical protein N0F65_008812 [Lagenidium giganteum]